MSSFLISVLIGVSSIPKEEFIKQLCSASQKQAEREKRATVQKKDLGRCSDLSLLDFGTEHSPSVTVSKRADEFWFLEGLARILGPSSNILNLTDGILPDTIEDKNQSTRNNIQKISPLVSGPLDRFADKNVGAL